MTLGNTPATSGQSEYKIKSGLGVGIFKNNPISIQDSSGDEGYIQDASFATTDDGGSGGAAFDNSGHACTEALATTQTALQLVMLKTVNRL
jgi:hypothetical protein